MRDSLGSKPMTQEPAKHAAATSEGDRRPGVSEVLAGIASRLADVARLLVSRRQRLNIQIDTPTGPRPAALYFPPATQARLGPGILILHTAFGRTFHEDATALRLANAGYVTLVVSYTTRTTGSVLQDPAQRATIEHTVGQARDRLAAEAGVDARRLGVIGFSLGGHFALALAMAGRVQAAVVYYGVYQWPESAAQQLRVPVLIHQGDRDDRAFRDNATAFAAAAPDKRCEVIMYGGAGHQFDFFQPRSSVTREAWARTVAFLAKALVERA
jgi:carboxymethylenebutenolidase